MPRIAGFDAELAHIAVGNDTVAVWSVANLERHVNRAKLLCADDGPEPPYWAHLWIGALLLAAVVPRARSALELGCDLGLPGLVAARRGARVTFLDRVPAALAFVRASAPANGFVAVDVVAADLTTHAVAATFDLVLAAEVLYDRQTFGPMARAIARHLAPGGRALLADAGRTDTRAFYAALETEGLRWRAVEHRVREEGLPTTVRVVEVERG